MVSLKRNFDSQSAELVKSQNQVLKLDLNVMRLEAKLTSSDANLDRAKDEVETANRRQKRAEDDAKDARDELEKEKNANRANKALVDELRNAAAQTTNEMRSLRNRLDECNNQRNGQTTTTTQDGYPFVSNQQNQPRASNTNQGLDRVDVIFVVSAFYYLKNCNFRVFFPQKVTISTQFCIQNFVAKKF